MAMDADCNEGKDDLSHSRGHPVESMNGEKALFPLGSYSSKVAGKETKGSGFLEEEVIIREEDVLIDRNGPIPSILFSNKVHDRVDQNIRNEIIVRLLGRVIGYYALVSCIKVLWKPIGEIQVIDLDNYYFIVRFTEERDYARVLSDGSHSHDGMIQHLEYELLQHICYECGVYGHSKDVCTSIQRQTKNGPVLMKPGVRNEANAAPKVSESELYGPRMVVGDKRRRSMASNPQVMANKSSVEVPGKGMSNSIATRLYKGSSSQSAAGGSHFTILSEESGSGNPDIDCMDVVNQLPLDANPDKRMKTPIVSTQDARVVPMVEGTCTSVVAHTTKTQAGSYVAVTLVEEGDKQVVSARLKHIKSKITAAKKGVKEAIKKPRVGKKSNVAKGGASRPKFIEWTQTFSKQLEVDRGDSSSGYDSSNINAENVLVEKDSLVVAGKVGAVKDITHHTLGLVDSCDATGEL
ncbi:hypothetical protein V6N11_082989 [Hibiscus sabdariffa]|uniref:DUF4283 domain-containing protein n=1 Tax=Hibiscus sabdariffa TaxID=183260 RepID=A0ABR2QKI7_9ROSI